MKQIVQQLREHLNFVTVSDVRASRPDHKQKGKSSAPNCEALILEAIRSGLRLQNVSNPNHTYGGTLMSLLFSISVSSLFSSSFSLLPGQFLRPQIVLLMNSCSWHVRHSLKRFGVWKESKTIRLWTCGCCWSFMATEPHIARWLSHYWSEKWYMVTLEQLLFANVCRVVENLCRYGFEQLPIVLMCVSAWSWVVS